MHKSSILCRNKYELPRNQSQQITIPSNTQSPSIVTQALQLLLNGAIFSMRAICFHSLSSTIKSYLKYLPLLPYNILIELKLFAVVLMYKINRFTFNQICIFESLYQGIGKLVDLMKKKLELSQTSEFLKEIKGRNCSENFGKSQFSNWLGIKEGDTEKLLEKIMQERQSIRTQNKRYYTKKNGSRQYLSQLLADKFQTSNKFNRLAQILIKLNWQEQTTNQKQRQAVFVQTIEEEKVPDGRCLGCASFFFQNMNIRDQAVSAVPFKVFSSIKQMKELQQQIKDQICAFLNAGGGVILFDLVKSYEKVIVKGFRMTQKQKQMYQQRLFSYLDCFLPFQQVKKCIKVSFVPVVADPLVCQSMIKYQTYAGIEGALKGNERYRVRPYLKGTFVMRVKVSPIDPTTIFVWKQASNKQLQERYINYHCGVHKDGKKQVIKISHLSKMIKRRIKDYYLSPQLTQKQRKMLQKPFSVFDHECRQPDAGFIVSEESQSSDSCQIDQKTFQYASLLIVSRQNLAKVRKAFRMEGVQCKIQHKFDKLNLQCAQNTALMYHNRKFQDLLTLINSDNTKFYFGGKCLIMISITPFLKLINRTDQNPYPQENFRILSKNISDEFPQESCRLLQFKGVKGVEYYIECQSVESTLLAYYLLNSKKQKTFLKNPQWEKRGGEELRQSLQVVFERKVERHLPWKEDSNFWFN